MKLFVLVTLLFLGVAGCDTMQSSSNSDTNESATSEPDNTAVNVRDRDTSTKTPIDQNENQADIDITAKIRKEVVDTKMSVNAQNVKIITQNGKVTFAVQSRQTTRKSELKKSPEASQAQITLIANWKSTIEVNNLK